MAVYRSVVHVPSGMSAAAPLFSLPCERPMETDAKTRKNLFPVLVWLCLVRVC